MKYGNNKYEDIKIAYIGGGSRGWAWGLRCVRICAVLFIFTI